MAQKCRWSGNAFEYLVCKCLQDRKIKATDAFTKSKVVRIKTQNIDKQEIKQVKLNKMMDALGITPKRTPLFSINHDNHGVSGDSSDVVLHPIDLKLSLKNNNNFIKHQRCNKLYLQLGLSPREEAQFKKQYKEINDRYYNMWTKKGHTKYHQVDTHEKFNMYSEINALTQQWLSKDPRHLERYISFVLDLHPNPNKYTIKWDNSRDALLVLSHHDINIKKMEMRIRNNSFLDIKLGDLLVKMRLHNASSRLRKTQSLKYSTSIRDFEKEFTKFIF